MYIPSEDKILSVLNGEKPISDKYRKFLEYHLVKTYHYDSDRIPGDYADAFYEHERELERANR